MPSLDTAKCCSISSLDASKKLGIAFSVSMLCGPRCTSASISVVGVRKSVEVSHTWSFSSASTASTLVLPKARSPTGNAVRAHSPSPGVSTHSRLLTSSSTFSTSRDLVQAKDASDAVSVGVNSTWKLRLPA